MEPSKKSEQLESDMTNIFGFNRRESIQSNKCIPTPIGCGREFDPATEFKDALSAKEFTISGMCQQCQDSFFG